MGKASMSCMKLLVALCVAVVAAHATEELVSLEEDASYSYKIDHNPPYKKWAKQAKAVPDSSLTPPPPKKSRRPPLNKKDVKKYGTTKKGKDDGGSIGMKLSLKELAVKAKMNKRTKKNNKNVEKDEKSKAKARKDKVKVKEFSRNFQKDKKSRAKAAKVPKKKKLKRSTNKQKKKADAKRSATAGKDAVKAIDKKANDGKHEDMGESDAVEKAACSKARVGVGAICKLSGQKSRACKSAQRTYAAKCGA